MGYSYWWVEHDYHDADANDNICDCVVLHSQLWLMHDGGKSKPIPNWEKEGGRAWSSSQPKSEAGGTKRRPPSCQLWPRLKPWSRHWCDRVQAAYIRRWSAVLACSVARAFSLSLVARFPVHGIGADIPSVHEVLRDAHFA